MAKVDKKKVKENLDKWAALQAKIGKIEADRNKKLEPFLRNYNEDTSPILEAAAAKVAPIKVEAESIQAEIIAMLNGDRDAEGNPKLVTIESGAASAQISKSEGARIVSVKAFFDSFKDKSAAFWDALTVGVSKAEKLLGKQKIDEISTKKTIYSSTISLKK